MDTLALGRLHKSHHKQKQKTLCFPNFPFSEKNKKPIGIRCGLSYGAPSGLLLRPLARMTQEIRAFFKNSKEGCDERL